MPLTLCLLSEPRLKIVAYASSNANSITSVCLILFRYNIVQVAPSVNQKAQVEISL